MDYECIDKTEFWIVEENPPGELQYDDLENMFEEELPKTGEESSSQPSTGLVKTICLSFFLWVIFIYSD